VQAGWRALRGIVPRVDAAVGPRDIPHGVIDFALHAAHVSDLRRPRCRRGAAAAPDGRLSQGLLRQHRRRGAERRAVGRRWRRLSLCGRPVAPHAVVVTPGDLVVHLRCFFDPPAAGRKSLGAGASTRTQREHGTALCRCSHVLIRMALRTQARADALCERHSAATLRRLSP
jgi:hypothetical protein